MKDRKLSDDDKILWQNFAREVSPLRLSGRVEPSDKNPALKFPTRRTSHDAVFGLPTVGRVLAERDLKDKGSGRINREVVVGQRISSLDNCSWRRLVRGHIKPTRVLDLHGMTARAAHRTLSQFLKTSYLRGHRCVEIITGLGSGSGGVLRRELPFWLEQPDIRLLILEVVYAHSANHGAIRILIKKGRQA